MRVCQYCGLGITATDPGWVDTDGSVECEKRPRASRAKITRGKRPHAPAGIVFSTPSGTEFFTGKSSVLISGWKEEMEQRRII